MLSAIFKQYWKQTFNHYTVTSWVGLIHVDGQYFPCYGTDKEEACGIVIETVLKHGRHSVNHLQAPSLTWMTGKKQLNRHKMDDLLLPKQTVGSSDDDIDKILFEACASMVLVSPPTTRRPKIASEKS